MTTQSVKHKEEAAREILSALRDELLDTDRGVLLLTMELEGRVEARTAELAEVHAELQKTNSELMQLTIDLEDRVKDRTAELLRANKTLQEEILQRKQSEQALRSSEERHRIVANFTHDWEYWISPEGKILYMSPSCERITGYPAEEFIQHPERLVSIVHPADRPACEEHEKLVSHENGDKSVHEMDFRILRRDGEERWIAHACQAICRPDGTFLGRRASNRDITERKCAEAELRKSEEKAWLLNQRLDTLREAIAQLAAVKSLEEIMAVARSAARRLTGADGATFVLRDGDRCFYADEDAIAPLWKGQRFPMSACISGWVMLHHCPVTIEDIYDDPRIPADAYRPTFVKSLAMVPIRAAEPLGAIGNYWATRHRPTAEELGLLQSLADSAAVAMENVESYRLLEQRIRERTAELQAANKELEAFSYSVSHDLRAPLRAVDGYARILEEDYQDRLDGEGRRLLDVVRGEAKRMGQLIDDLLAFSRLGRQAMHRAPTDMTAMAREVFDALMREHLDRAVDFRLDGIESAEADEALMRHVWANLLDNAFKYTRGREPARIEVGGRIEGNESVYWIKDNGAGFDMKYADKLFRVFQRLHTQDEFEGTGVGLALVQRIIHRHGGRVWAEGEADRGATFCFALPRRKEEP